MHLEERKQKMCVYILVGITSLYIIGLISYLRNDEENFEVLNTNPAKNNRSTSTVNPETAKMSRETRNLSDNMLTTKSRKDGSEIESLPKSVALEPEQNNKTTKTISMKLIGKIGNHMFKYASTFCFGRKYNRRVVYNSTLLRSLFPYLSAQNELPDEYNSKANHSSSGGGSFGDCRITDISKFLQTNAKQHYRLDGYLQTWCYFADCEEEIRKEFRFHPNLVAARDKFLYSEATAVFGKHASASKITYIGVHIRRGNFVTTAKYVPGRVVAPASYFEHAVRYMENATSKSKHKIYVVASNDLHWSRENFKAPHPVVFVDYSIKDFPKSNLDFAILAGCNHTIMSVGTYSWWAAYMAGGTTVYYQVYPSDMPLERKEAHYLPGWVGLA